MKSNTIGCVSGNSAGLAMRMVSPTGGLNVINIVVVREEVREEKHEDWR